MRKVIIVSAKYRTHLLVLSSHIHTHTLTPSNIESQNNDVSEKMVVKLKNLVLHFWSQHYKVWDIPQQINKISTTLAVNMVQIFFFAFQYFRGLNVVSKISKKSFRNNNKIKS